MDVVDREHELGVLDAFLGGDDGQRPALLMVGAAGIGKTTLWEHAVRTAGERGARVLATRSSEAEEALSFAGLTDLLDGVDADDLAGLPLPQRRALEVALARAEPGAVPPEPLAIAAGVLGLLRALSARAPLVVAVDNLQWLDPASADALAFALRRLRAEPVRVLGSLRPGQTSPVERALARDRVQRLEVGPIALPAARRLLSERLHLTVPRPVLARLVDLAHGNPLVVLELGRVLLERGTLDVDSGTPAAELADDLFGARVESLPAAVRRVVLAVGLAADLRRPELAALADQAAIDQAVAYGMLTIEADRARASHPLLAAAAVRGARVQERREVHLQLSEILADGPRSARHLALATDAPDADRAQPIAAAAKTARRRGASLDAVELAEHALRLTPSGDPAHVERLLELAEYLMSAGAIVRLRELLEGALDRIPPGAPRVRAHVMLGHCADIDGHIVQLELALAESAAVPLLRAAVLAEKARVFAVIRVERIAETTAWAQEAVAIATAAGGKVGGPILAAVAWTRILGGVAVDDLLAQARTVDDGTSLYEGSIERVAGVRHAFRGEIAEAGALFERLLALADERGEAISGEVAHLQLLELAMRTGELGRARELLAGWDDEWGMTEGFEPSGTRCRAMFAALVGDTGRAEALGRDLNELTDIAVWDVLEARRARGLAAVLERRPADAAEHFGEVWAHLGREGVEDPGAFPVAPDLVEALVELERIEEARAVIARLRELAEAQSHPWGLAAVARCEAVVALAGEYSGAAVEALSEAAGRFAELGLGFDRARSLLSLGALLRRHRKWGAARDALDDAAAGFAALGCDGWVRRVEADLERVGARRPAGEGVLTAAEERVVALAIDGKSNKEIAAALVVSIHTVEVHLSRAYAKLGVRKRTQLAGAIEVAGAKD
jgi:DNA-binding CsgD family transcriptional regulator